MLTDRQRKVLADSFVMVGAGAHRGKRMLDTDVDLPHVQAHVDELYELITTIKESVDKAAGATEILKRTEQQKRLAAVRRMEPGRAKPLSTARRTT